MKLSFPDMVTELFVFNLFGCLVNRHVVQVELAPVSPLLKQ